MAKEERKSILQRLAEPVRNQNGFGPIVIILIIITLMAVVYAAYNQMGQASTSAINTSEQSAKAIAASVMSQGGELTNGANITAAKNNIALSALTWDATATTGIFNPSTGGAVRQTPPPTATASTQAWVNKVDGSGNPVVKVNGIGVTANADYVLALPDVKLTVCQGINNALFGTALSATPPTGAGALADWTTAATAVDMSAVAAVLNWMEGCVATSDSKYVYFKVISPQ